MNKTEVKKDIGASVIGRLTNISKETKEDFNFLLERYCIERLLYRLSISPFADRFILKGGTLFLAWQGKNYRVTRDLDLLGFGSQDVEETRQLFQAICTIEVQDADGIIFDTDSIEVSAKREDEVYAGLEIKLNTKIVNTKQRIQIDIGFGDAITPHSEKIEFPTLLGMQAPKLRSYPKYTVIAEKFEALVSIGFVNTRLKDFYDLWIMCRLFDFEGNILQDAIKNTFIRRKTDLPSGLPIGLTSEFYSDNSKVMEWKRFVKTKKLETFGEDLTLETTALSIQKFLMPIVEACHNNQEFQLMWDKESGSWNEPQSTTTLENETPAS